jgi:hypothetical protein
MCAHRQSDTPYQKVTPWLHVDVRDFVAGSKALYFVESALV